MNRRDTTFASTSAVVDGASAGVAAPAETAQPGMSSKLRVAGSEKPPCLNEALEAPPAPLLSAMLLSSGASARVDASQDGGCAPPARAAAATTMVAIANVAPRPTVGRGAGSEGGEILSTEDRSRKVGVALARASVQPFARDASETSRNWGYDNDSDGTGGGLPRRGGNTTPVSVPFPCRATCTRPTMTESLQRKDDLCAAAAADVLESPATPPPSEGGACTAYDDMGNPLHSPGMGKSGRPRSGCASPSASSAPHSTAETQWHNTSETSELDLGEVLLPVTGAATDDLSAVSSVTASSALGMSASTATTPERSVVPAPTVVPGAAGRSPISPSETTVRPQRSSTCVQQPAKLNDWRRKWPSDNFAMQSEKGSGSYNFHGDAPLASPEDDVVWCSGRSTDGRFPSPTTLRPQQQKKLCDSNDRTPFSAEVPTSFTLAPGVPGSLSNPSSCHPSRRALDSHPTPDRGAPITTICGPYQAMAPSSQLSTPICPGGATVASASLEASIQSPLGLPMLMSGSIASLVFPRRDIAFPLRATPHMIGNSAGDELGQPSPRRHAQRHKGDSQRPLLPSTAPVATPTAQHVSSFIAAAWRKSLNDSPLILSRQRQCPQHQQQVQQVLVRRLQHGEASTPDSDSLDSLPALPQQSLRSFTVTSATSFCADSVAAVRSPNPKAAEHSSLHDSAMSIWQSSTTSEDRILQTLAHGMALGGVVTGPWKAAQGDAMPPPSHSRGADVPDRCLTEKPLAPQRSLSRSSHLAASRATGADKKLHYSPWSCTTLPLAPSLLVPHMRGADMSQCLGSGTRASRSRGKRPTAALASSLTHFSEPQPKQGKVGGMSSPKPAEEQGTRRAQVCSLAAVSAPSEVDETADTSTHSLASSPLTAVLTRPSSKWHMEVHTPKRLQQHRGHRNSGYFAVANSSLRGASGSAAATLPSLVGSAPHTERSLVTPMRGYSVKHHSTTASVASSALSQAPFVVEGVVSAGGTPCVASCIEAPVATRWRVASADTAARRAGGDRAVMQRSHDSRTAHYRIFSSDFWSATDSSIAVAESMDARLGERLTFLQSVHDVGGFVEQAAASATPGCTAAVPSLLAEETAKPAAAAPSHVPSPLSTPVPSSGLASGQLRGIDPGGAPEAPSFVTAGTVASSSATAAAAPSGSSVQSFDGVSESLSAKPTPSEPIRVANGRAGTQSSAPRTAQSSVGAPPPPKSVMFLCPSWTRRPSYRIPESEAVAAPPLTERLSIQNALSARPSDSARSAFLPVLPLAPEEQAATSSMYELDTPRAISPMPAGPEAGDSVAATHPQELRGALAVVRPTAAHGSSGESCSHFTSLSISCRSPPGILPSQQQRVPRRLQMCLPASMAPPFYGDRDDQGTRQVDDRRSSSESTRTALILSSVARSSNSIAHRAAGTETGGSEGYGQSYRAQGEAHLHERGALTGSSSQYHRSGRRGGGIGTGAPLHILIPRYQRRFDAEALLDEAERAMNRTGVPIVSLLGCGGWSANGEECSFEMLGNGLGSSVMSLATTALATSITGPNMGVVSPLVPGSTSDKPVASPTGTVSSLSASAQSHR
ncbi:hypothetical protein LSCM1_04159 [Leishmania martiniquensis]|uniref:Uncharacterized protein n=1 Tax=Leishmania martiniquensis TaxID=1580590 RepID=A0A836KSC2_9TRYP|nr:hypothetical protein LSCM1_04159 [Leishmania martiniquensis]